MKKNDDFLTLEADLLKNPEFKRLYDQADPEFEIARSLIAARVKRKLTQSELAEKVGTKQPSISKIESGKGGFSWKFLKRIGDALNAEVTPPKFIIKE